MEIYFKRDIKIELVNRTYRKTVMNKLIDDTISDLVSDFLYYDRKTDEELPLNKVEELIRSKTLTVDEMVNCFKKHLTSQLDVEL